MKLAIPLTIIAAAVLLSFTILLPGSALAQKPAPFDKAPEPVGGLAAIMHEVSYPEAAKKDEIEGKVLLTVVIDTAGHAKSVTVKQGVRNDIDQAAVTALKKSEWIPAQKDGKAVESTVIVPVQFKLEAKK